MMVESGPEGIGMEEEEEGRKSLGRGEAGKVWGKSSGEKFTEEGEGSREEEGSGFEPRIGRRRERGGPNPERWGRGGELRT